MKTLALHVLKQQTPEPLTGADSDLEAGLVCREVAVHALVRVTDVPLVTRVLDLAGAALAAAAPVQHRAHPRGTLRFGSALTGPVAELPSLDHSPGLPRSQQLPMVALSPAEILEWWDIRG